MSHIICRVYIVTDVRAEALELFEKHPSVQKDFVHCCIAETLLPFVDHPQVAAALHVEQYTIEKFAAHLFMVLPSHWAGTGIGSNPSIDVPWANAKQVGSSHLYRATVSIARHSYLPIAGWTTS